MGTLHVGFPCGVMPLVRWGGSSNRVVERYVIDGDYSWVGDASCCFVSVLFYCLGGEGGGVDIVLLESLGLLSHV